MERKEPYGKIEEKYQATSKDVIRNLTETEIKFLNLYRGLPEKKQMLLTYLLRIAASRIFTDAELSEFCELMR